MFQSFLTSKLPTFQPQPISCPPPTSSNVNNGPTSTSTSTSSAVEEDRWLCCTGCGYALGRTSSSIVDDTYHVYSKPAYLLASSVDLAGCRRSLPEKRAMRSGTYDIEWLTCGCGVALGFVYVHVYDDSFAYKLGKSVMLQEKLLSTTLSAAARPAAPPSLPPLPQPQATTAATVAVTLTLTTTGTEANTAVVANPFGEAEAEGYVIVNAEPDDGVIAIE